MRDWSLDLIDHQVKNLGRLIEDLLDISRISQGKVLLRKEVVDLSPVIVRAVDSVSALVEEREHELSIALPPQPMPVDADPLRLEQVFINLLTNAAKYTPSGGRIRLIAEAEAEHFTVRVRYTGEGISAEMLPRLFEMFTHWEASADHTRGGLGIGLSLAKNLLQMHGGTLTATSEGPGKGSEFVVSLPGAATPASSPMPPNPAEPSEGFHRRAAERSTRGGSPKSHPGDTNTRTSRRCRPCDPGNRHPADGGPAIPAG